MDPTEWTLKMKNAIFPYQEVEVVQKSKYPGKSYDPRPEKGETERFLFDEDYLTTEITIVFSKIR